jgi:putative solute:sodium symporter small subunit
MESFEDSERAQLTGIMGLYLIHNRSALTDAKFLGFPFHYFYTAVFLLILFVGLCWLYCVRTDMYNKKYGIED